MPPQSIRELPTHVFLLSSECNGRFFSSNPISIFGHEPQSAPYINKAGDCQLGHPKHCHSNQICTRRHSSKRGPAGNDIANVRSPITFSPTPENAYLHETPEPAILISQPSTVQLPPARSKLRIVHQYSCWKCSEQLVGEILSAVRDAAIL